MVQLKVFKVLWLAGVGRMFQFLYGTIKSAVHKRCNLHQKSFNSSMVQLKAAMMGGGLVANNRFQFLYGTIKREQVSNAGYIESRFQFLYGTIKSFFYRPIFVPFQSFNSSMVQLKVAFHEWIVSFPARFQFLYGTIKRRRMAILFHC